MRLRCAIPYARAALAIMIAATLAACDSESSGAAAETAAHPLLKKWCSDCHAPPRPQDHAPHEWPAIVARMQQHRSTKGLGPIDGQDLSPLIEYLQSHAHP